MPRLLPLFVVCCLSGAVLIADDSPATTPPLSFERDIRPLLQAACSHCHGEEEELSGGLDVRLRRFLVRGGDSGAAIVPERSAESLLVQRIRDREMPPPEAGKPLSEQQIALLARWIDLGAPTLSDEPEELPRGLVITQADREWWAFRPVVRPGVPVVKHADRVRTPIDAFVLEKLESQGFSLSDEADRRTLLRRASFDLTGLPPSVEELEAFENDSRTDAWERVIDRLLDSPRFGERWASHWLDVAGYADSEGVTAVDPERKWAWKYRDYVVRSFNDNKPFDQFVREQLAGDELLPPPYENLTPEQIDQLTATGFLRLVPDGTMSNEVEASVARNQVVADTLEVVGSALLGMTVQCAQCHEHRYDPIPQADYYRLRAVFEPALNWKAWRPPAQRLVTLYTDADRSAAAELEKEALAVLARRTTRQNEFIEEVFQQEIAKVPDDEREVVAAARNTAEKDRSAEQKKLMQKYPSVNVSAGSLYLYNSKAAAELKAMADEAEAIRKRKPKEEFVRALTEPAGTEPPPTFLFARGDHDQPKEQVVPASLSVLEHLGPTAIPADDPELPTSGRRLAFARQLTEGRHPLLTRVTVNRLWLHLVGRGIVTTPADFGRLGAAPSHPELLDWLADEFVRTGWDQKRMIKLIMLSSVYRQSLASETRLHEVDPDNALFGSATLKRLDAESLRDAVLAVSGRLNDRMYGEPVPVMADLVGQWVIGIENLDAGRPGATVDMQGEEFRRSIYVQVRRSRPLAVLETFDRPRMEPNCDCRNASTVSTQSLMLMNGTFVLEQSEQFADRVLGLAHDDLDGQIAWAWKIALSRDPTDSERADARQFLEEQRAELTARAGKNDDPARQALASLCQILLGSNEFLYLD